MGIEERTCKHYNGDFANTHCCAGVCYDDVTPHPDMTLGKGLRKPCIKNNHPEQGTCDKFEIYTQEELKEQERRLQKQMEQMQRELPFFQSIKFKYGKGVKVSVDCIRCGVLGHLMISISDYNGHMHARCKTENCINFME